MSPAILAQPDESDALATAGTLCHFIASDPTLTELFRVWIEHHPGDLTTQQVLWYLGQVHDLVSPLCDLPATADFAPHRRQSPMGGNGQQRPRG